MKTLDKKRGITVATRLLEQVGRCLTPDVARQLVLLRADDKTQARVAELAEKCNEAELTADERAEYETYVSTSTFIGILEAQARALLARYGKR
jgi:hypothetical protein